jgi:hypothetical protein
MNVESQLPMWANVLVMLVAIGAAVYERLRSAKLMQSAQLNTAKDELIKVLEADRDAWKSRYEAEHDEFVKRRQQYHDDVQKTQSRTLVLTEENAALKAKTDITPILTELQAQSSINKAVLHALEELTKRIDGRG